MKDELGQKLHDRATRGQKLSTEEQEQLEAWYAKMDRAEAADLGLGKEAPEGALPALIEKTLAEIAGATRRIRELDRQAREIEQENGALRARLSRHLSTQHA